MDHAVRAFPSRALRTAAVNCATCGGPGSTPVLGPIFLKFAGNRYRQHEQASLADYARLKGSRREKPVSAIAIEQCGCYLPDHARYDYLLTPTTSCAGTSCAIAARGKD
jgi:hypothetical protein